MVERQKWKSANLRLDLSGQLVGELGIIVVGNE